MASTFRSSRLVYRAVELGEHASWFHTLRSDVEGRVLTSANRLVKPPLRTESEKYLQDIRDHSLLGVLICLPIDGLDPVNAGLTATPIGYIHLSLQGPQFAQSRSTDIALQISAKERGKGYGTEAINWALDWAFKIAGLHRVGIGCLSFNEGARRLYERMGFVLEGSKRECVWWNGEWYDAIEFAMLEGEWKELRAKQVGGEM
jgi:RimJ/RimL family protein N-acetyltransferase